MKLKINVDITKTRFFVLLGTLFLIGGLVYVQGQPNVLGHPLDQIDTENAEIGTWPANSDFAYFGHFNLNHEQSGKYALLQDSNGRTFINSPSEIFFRINNLAAPSAMKIFQDGRVGIGFDNSDPDPTTRLHVMGDIRSTNRIDTVGGGNIESGNDVLANRHVSASLDVNSGRNVRADNELRLRKGSEIIRFGTVLADNMENCQQACIGEFASSTCLSAFGTVSRTSKACDVDSFGGDPFICACLDLL